MEKDWDAIRELAVEYAVDNMTNRKMNCSESVFEALIRSGAVDAPLSAVALATGFGGGGGGVGFTCGALASAILANSMVHGRVDPPSAVDRMELKGKFYQRYNNLVSEFVKIAGSGLCREIVNAFPDGYVDEHTRPNCLRIAGEAAGIAVDFLRISPDDAAMLSYDEAVVGINNWFN
ncbi:MAG: C-GCAxxG-C-C family protein [Oscillospiraceae bacterium]|nr:C-GCAxxG-C-C family protein [Oscillospiraceae bacterium]